MSKYDDAESLRGELRRLEELEQNPAFIFVIERLQADINAMQNALVLKPLSSMDEVLGQEYKKGQVEGRLSLALYITQRKEELNYELDLIKKEIENEDAS